MWGCSLGVSTLLGGDEALAWHAPGGFLRPPYQWRRLSLRARAPEQHSGTPLRARPRELSRRRPWESNRCEVDFAVSLETLGVTVGGPIDRLSTVRVLQEMLRRQGGRGRLQSCRIRLSVPATFASVVAKAFERIVVLFVSSPLVAAACALLTRCGGKGAKSQNNLAPYCSGH